MTEKIDLIDEELEEKPEVKTFTQEEVDKLLQANGDKRVSDALKTSKEKWEAEYKEKLEAEKSEAEKLARMSEAEKANHEFEQERQAFLKQKAEFDKAQLEVQAIKELSNKSLPTSFVNFILAEDAETINKNIESLQAEWSNAIQAEVNERLKGRTPQAGIGSQYANMSYEEFGKLPTKERAKLVDIDPDLLNKIKK